MVKSKRSHRAREIERVIAYVFAQKGYHSTTMRDIARELGMHQSSLYYYFKSKEDILCKLMMDTMETGIAGLEKICSGHDSAEEKLNRAFAFYIQHFAGNRDRHILLESEVNSLSTERRRIVVDKQKRYVDLVRTVIMELFKKQKVKNIHPTIATFAFFGMANYITKWYNPDGPVKPERLAEMFTEILTNGLYREKTLDCMNSFRS